MCVVASSDRKNPEKKKKGKEESYSWEESALTHKMLEQGIKYWRRDTFAYMKAFLEVDSFRQQDISECFLMPGSRLVCKGSALKFSLLHVCLIYGNSPTKLWLYCSENLGHRAQNLTLLFTSRQGAFLRTSVSLTYNIEPLSSKGFVNVTREWLWKPL